MGSKKYKVLMSRSQKEAKDFAWYKDQADRLESEHSSDKIGYGGISEDKRMQVNYDLFNNILDKKDFEYVCNPFGAESGELPAEMVNRDISSGKIKALLGMEMKRPFAYKTFATNPEATTRREQEEMGRIREYLIDQIMGPIREQVEIEYQQQTLGRELEEEELEQLKQEMEQRIHSMTPDEVRKYMQREHQDPAEVLSQQLLNYLTQKLGLEKKFDKMFLHGLLVAKEVCYVGAFQGHPQVLVVNPKRFTYDNSPDIDFIEDGEYAVCEYRMSPSGIIGMFDDLTNKEIERIYNEWEYVHAKTDEDLFRMADRQDSEDNGRYISVFHTVWKAPRKIGFLKYLDEEGFEREVLVDETYEINTDTGDIEIDWQQIPEAYETWKIKVSTPIYKNMRPIPGQFKDLDNLYHCKLPYYGAIHDNLNSQPTSLMDRLKIYQYFYNILWYRFELLAATDKGKKVLMNIGMIPSSQGIDIKKWQYFVESTPYMWFDPNEEGTGYGDANNIAKVLDLSYAGQMNQYIEMMEYVRQQAGKSVGITDQVEGQIAAHEAVRNTQQALVQTSYISEPYFKLHEHVKANVLQALLEVAKVEFSVNPPESLTWVLDDMSLAVISDSQIAEIDNDTIGIFVSDSSKAEEALDMIRQLSHAALQNQQAELSDVMALIRQDSFIEAEELLKVAEEKRREYEREVEEGRNESQERMQEMQINREREQEEAKLNFMHEEYDRKEKLEIIKGSLIGASFNPDLDKDEDGINDFIEIARHGLDADIQQSKQQLEREKFEHQKEMDKISAEQEDKKIKNDAQKLKGAIAKK